MGNRDKKLRNLMAAEVSALKASTKEGEFVQQELVGVRGDGKEATC